MWANRQSNESDGSIECEAFPHCPLQTAQELRQLFRLLEAYTCAEWLVFDASIMRGLAYYTGQSETCSIRQIQCQVLLTSICTSQCRALGNLNA